MVRALQLFIVSMKKLFSLRYLLSFILSLWLLTLSAQDQYRIDSLLNLINSRGAEKAQKAEWLFQLADLYYYTQNEEIEGVLDEAGKIVDQLKDPCLQAALGVLEAKHLNDKNLITESKQKSRMVLELAREHKCVKAEADILLHLAFLHLYNAGEDSCILYIQQAKSRAEESNDSLMIAKANRTLGLSYYIDNQFQKSNELLQLSYNFFLRYGEGILEGTVLSDISECYYMESNYDSALFYAKKADSVLEKNAGFYELAVNCNMTGLIYQSTGPIEEAIVAYYKGLRIADKYNDASLKVLFLYNLGNCYFELNALDIAAEKFQLCLSMARQASDTSMIIYSLSALGNLALGADILDTAYHYLKKSLELAIKTNETDILGFLYASLADLKIETKEYHEAQTYINKALEYAQASNSPEEMISVNVSQAMLYAATNRYKKSTELLLNTLQQSKKIKSVDGLRMSLESLAEVYEMQKDYKNALLYSHMVKEFEDSTKLTSTLQKFIHTEWQFERDKAERIRQLEVENTNLEHRSKLKESRLVTLISLIGTITFLLISLFLYLLVKSSKRRAKILEEKNRLVVRHHDELSEMVSRLTQLTEELRTSNNTKSKLFSIIAHDLVSPFHVIQGYSNLLLTENLDNNTREIYCKRIATSSEKLVEMINTLLEWAMSQSGSIQLNPIPFDITTTTNDLIATTQIFADKKQIEILKEYDQDSELMITADVNMFNRILHNLLVNAIKYTPKNGQVSVGWILERDQVTIFVKDTGVGMSADMAATIFETSFKNINKGTDGETGTGLGLNICREFVKRHNGVIWAESEPGKGSKFSFRLNS